MVKHRHYRYRCSLPGAYVISGLLFRDLMLQTTSYERICMWQLRGSGVVIVDLLYDADALLYDGPSMML